eukprot:3384025-Heterocapsa_arctica.AAC.1
MGGLWQDRFDQAVVDLEYAVDDTQPTMPLADFVVLVYAAKAPWLTQQVIGQVAVLVDQLWPEKGFTTNPLDVEEDISPLPKHARHDAELLDKLAMGEGLGSDTSRA